MTLHYVNYNRKSSDSEDRQILSIVAQQESAQEIAKKDGLTIYEVINESKSAKTPELRPHFSRMISEIKRGHYNAIICWKLDRLARNMDEGGKIIELIQQKKIVEIRTHAKTYTIRDNIILLSVEFGSANQYSRDLSDNVKRGQKKKAQLGLPPGNAPFGFLNKHDSRGFYWAIDNNRMEIMRAIFNKILERSLSPNDVYRWAIKTFNPTTVQHKRIGGKKIAVSYYYKLLRNPLYAGYFHLDGEEYTLDPSLTPILTRAQFNAVQRLLTSKRAPNTIKHTAIYSGLIKSPDNEYMGADFKHHLTCDCGHKFSHVHKTHCPECQKAIRSMKNPRYASYTYYYNVAKKKRKEKVRMLSESVIEKELHDFFSVLHFSNDMKQWLMENVPKESETALSTINLKNTSEALLKKRKTLRDMLADGLITKDEFLSDIQEIDAKLETIETPNEEKEMGFKLSIQDALNAYDSLNNDDPIAKKGVLKRIGSNLMWDEKNLVIHWPKWLITFREGIKEAMQENERFEPRKNLTNTGEIDNFDPTIPTLRSTLNQVRNNCIDNYIPKNTLFKIKKCFCRTKKVYLELVA